MTLEALYYVSQIVAVLAILGSLIFVGIQIRQNTKQARAAAAQSVYENYASWYMFAGESVERARIGMKALKDPDSLSDEENAIFMGGLLAQFSYLQSAFFLWQDGSLKDEVWRSMEATVTTILTTSGGKAFWKRRRFSFTEAFCVHIETNALNRPLPEGMRPWSTPDKPTEQSTEEPDA
ncbi:MAG: hypothetical protein AAFQ22_02775 [Pseudomonadota bacterium]